MAEEKEVGKVTHYFTKIGVAIVDLTEELKVGDTIHIKGHTSDFTQKVESMQIEHEQVEKAGKGKAIGLKVNEHAREGDVVYKVIE
jgi:putative protease